MSASVVSQPRLRRIAPCASSAPNPSPASTCEGCTFPRNRRNLKIPRYLRDRSRSRRSLPSGREPSKSVVFGSRATSSRKSPASRGSAAGPSSSRFRKRFDPGHSPSQRRHGGPHGRPETGDCRRRSRFRRGGPFPGRRPGSTAQARAAPSARTSAPTPFGPPILCAETREDRRPTS